jgi:RHS repeat-associated protein
LTSAGATTYSYDPNGNLYTRVQGGNTTTYTFDSQDRLTNISSPPLNFQYQYDGLFNRASKTDAGTTTKYLVDPNGFLPQVIAEMDGAYNITSYYVYDGMGLVAKMTPSGSIYFYHYNGSGNTIAMTDASGNMVNKYAYDEFGNLVNVQETVPNPFLFGGQYGVMDDDNGLLYMRARYYDPQVGRFINKDPIGYRGGLNLFAYAGSNPLNWIDPLGLEEFLISPLGISGTLAWGTWKEKIVGFNMNFSVGVTTRGFLVFKGEYTSFEKVYGAFIGAGYPQIGGSILRAPSKEGYCESKIPGTSYAAAFAAGSGGELQITTSEESGVSVAGLLSRKDAGFGLYFAKGNTFTGSYSIDLKPYWGKIFGGL